jgi:hypothetical protein
MPIFMNLFRLLIRPYLQALYGFHKITGTGSFGRQQARYITPAPLNGDNPLKKALFKHYVRQFHESSCSVASVATVVNAILEVQGKPSTPPLTQADLLDNVKAANWKKRMSPEGDNGKRGLPLFMLGDVVKNSLDTYGISYKSVETVQVSQDPKETEKHKRILISRLHELEPGGKSVIIAHFNQGIFVKALQIPHISPVGGFDIRTDTVTMLDVDYLQENPYTITFDTFYKGLASDYNALFRSFGYGSGGYVYIRL